MSVVNYRACLVKVLQWEGGFVHHPNDPGGATNMGITLGTYRAYAEDHGLDQPSVDDLRIIDEYVVSHVYQSRYWNAVQGDDLPSGVDLIVFDAAVLSGPRQAAKTLQRCVGVDDDGVIGPVTLKAVYDFPSKASLVRAYGHQREAFFKGIVSRRAKSRVFLKGWLNRLKDVVQTALQMVHD